MHLSYLGPVSHILSSLGAHLQEWGVAAALKLLWQVFSFLSALRAHELLTGGLQSLMTVTSLLIDTAGNTPFLRAFSKYLRHD